VAITVATRVRRSLMNVAQRLRSRADKGDLHGVGPQILRAVADEIEREALAGNSRKDDDDE